MTKRNTQQRRHLILTQVNELGEVAVDILAEQFQTSEVSCCRAGRIFVRALSRRHTDKEKLMHGLTPIRESDIFSEQMTEMAPKLGGLVEFYRSPNESNCQL